MNYFRKAHPVAARRFYGIKFIAITLSFAITITSLSYYLFDIKRNSYASIVDLPIKSVLPVLSSPINGKPQSCPVLKGLHFDPQSPFSLKFLLDTMDKNDVSEKELNRLIRYFLGFLTVPEEKVWVNLSPYEKDRVTSAGLADLDLGKDLLLEDYLLKQVASSLTNPNTREGKKFWQEVYKAAQNVAQTTRVPINNFYKIWIVPDKAEVCEYRSQTEDQRPQTKYVGAQDFVPEDNTNQNKTIAFVKEAKLKVMMEEDHHNNVMQQGKGLISPVPNRHNLKIQNPAPYNFEFSGVPPDNRNKKVREINAEAKEIFKRELLPIIEEQVNSSEMFAPLRQLYYSLILAAYFKQKFQNHEFFKHYIDKEKSEPIMLNNPKVKDSIYQAYLRLFKKGTHDEKICVGAGSKPALKYGASTRRYFSGGFSSFGFLTNTLKIYPQKALDKMKSLVNYCTGKLKEVDLLLKPEWVTQTKMVVGNEPLSTEFVETICSKLYGRKHDSTFVLPEGVKPQVNDFLQLFSLSARNGNHGLEEMILVDSIPDPIEFTIGGNTVSLSLGNSDVFFTLDEKDSTTQETVRREMVAFRNSQGKMSIPKTLYFNLNDPFIGYEALVQLAIHEFTEQNGRDSKTGKINFEVLNAIAEKSPALREILVLFFSRNNIFLQTDENRKFVSYVKLGRSNVDPVHVLAEFLERLHTHRAVLLQNYCVSQDDLLSGDSSEIETFFNERFMQLSVLDKKIEDLKRARQFLRDREEAIKEINGQMQVLNRLAAVAKINQQGIAIRNYSLVTKRGKMVVVSIDNRFVRNIGIGARVRFVQDQTREEHKAIVDEVERNLKLVFDEEFSGVGFPRGTFYIVPDSAKIEREMKTLEKINQEIQTLGCSSIRAVNYLLQLVIPPSSNNQAGVIEDYLDQSQKEAVSRMGRESCAVIIGPFGTGKTHTATSAMEHMVKDNKETVVFLAQKHRNVDDVTLRLGYSGLPVLRFGNNPKRYTRGQDGQPVAKDYIYQNNDALIKFEEKFKDNNKNSGDTGCVLTATVSGGTADARLRQIFNHQRKLRRDAGKKEEGPVLVMDEASTIPYAELLQAVYEMNPSRIILLGDHHQFGVYPLNQQERNGLSMDNIRRYILSIFYDLVKNDGYKKAQLSVCYRNHWAISRFPIRQFYNNELSPSKLRMQGKLEEDTVVIQDSQKLYKKEDEAIFYEQTLADSPCNRLEAKWVIQRIKKRLTKCRVTGQLIYEPEDIMIMTPYLGQVELIKEEIDKQYMDPTFTFVVREALKANITTTFSAQGLENKVVIASLVKNLTKEALENKNYGNADDLALVAEPELLNVLITRAIEALEIIGNQRTLTALTKDLNDPIAQTMYPNLFVYPQELAQILSRGGQYPDLKENGIKSEEEILEPLPQEPLSLDEVEIVYEQGKENIEVTLLSGETKEFSKISEMLQSLWNESQLDLVRKLGYGNGVYVSNLYHDKINSLRRATAKKLARALGLRKMVLPKIKGSKTKKEEEPKVLSQDRESERPEPLQKIESDNVSPVTETEVKVKHSSKIQYEDKKPEVPEWVEHIRSARRVQNTELADSEVNNEQLNRQFKEHKARIEKALNQLAWEWEGSREITWKMIEGACGEEEKVARESLRFLEEQGELIRLQEKINKNLLSSSWEPIDIVKKNSGKNSFHSGIFLPALAIILASFESFMDYYGPYIVGFELLVLAGILLRIFWHYHGDKIYRAFFSPSKSGGDISGNSLYEVLSKRQQKGKIMPLTKGEKEDYGVRKAKPVIEEKVRNPVELIKRKDSEVDKDKEPEAGLSSHMIYSIARLGRLKGTKESKQREKRIAADYLSGNRESLDQEVILDVRNWEIDKIKEQALTYNLQANQCVVLRRAIVLILLKGDYDQAYDFAIKQNLTDEALKLMPVMFGKDEKLLTYPQKTAVVCFFLRYHDTSLCAKFLKTRPIPKYQEFEQGCYLKILGVCQTELQKMDGLDPAKKSLAYYGRGVCDQFERYPFENHLDLEIEFYEYRKTFQSMVDSLSQVDGLPKNKNFHSLSFPIKSNPVGGVSLPVVKSGALQIHSQNEGSLQYFSEFESTSTYNLNFDELRGLTYTIDSVVDVK